MAVGDVYVTASFMLVLAATLLVPTLAVATTPLVCLSGIVIPVSLAAATARKCVSIHGRLGQGVSGTGRGAVMSDETARTRPYTGDEYLESLR